MEPLQTARLLLTPLVADDFPWMIALQGDAAVMRYISPGGRSELEARAMLERMLAQGARLGWGLWTIRERASGERLGAAMLIERTPGAFPELGYSLATNAAGRGIATEACRALLAHGVSALGLTQLHAVVSEGNAASIAVLRKLGMREVGSAPGLHGGRDLRFELPALPDAAGAGPS